MGTVFINLQEIHLKDLSYVFWLRESLSWSNAAVAEMWKSLCDDLDMLWDLRTYIICILFLPLLYVCLVPYGFAYTRRHRLMEIKADGSVTMFNKKNVRYLRTIDTLYFQSRQ